MAIDIGEFQPQSLDLVMPLNAPDTISWTQNLQDPMSRKDRLNPSVNDWRIERNGVPLSAGIFIPQGIDLDTDSRALNVTGASWLSYFSMAFLDYKVKSNLTPQNITFTNTDMFDIVRGLITAVANQAGGDDFIPLTFWSDTEKCGTKLNAQFLASDQQDLLTMITDLAGRIDGFDFWITPDCVFTMACPHRGTQSLLVLAQGKNIQRVQYQNTGFRANRVIAVGSGSGSSTVIGVAGETSEADEGAGEARLFTEVATFSNLRSPNQIDKLAAAEFALASQEQRTLTVTTRPVPGENHWELASVGDYIWVQFDLEYEKIDGYLRCTQIELAPTDQGDEIIIYTFAPNTINTGQ